MLERARASYSGRRWADAYDQLAHADAERALDVDDLERLATAARMTGRLEETCAALARAYQQAVRSADHARAARFSFWSGMEFMNAGQQARAQGWFTRGDTLVREHALEGAERGYLLIPLAFAALGQGGMERAIELFTEAEAVGRRSDDRDLVALARQSRGRVLIQVGRAEDGLRLLDETMVAITAGEVSDVTTGIVYCSVIEACKEMYDLRRAQEWTAALTRWCASQPGLVPFRGQCLVYRAELMRLHGAWPDAMQEAERARQALANGAGGALYEQAELHRLRGEYDRAEECLRAAGAQGHSTQPALPLLRLAQGRADVALSGIQRALDETRPPLERARLLPAYVEISLAAANISGARVAADELVRICASYGSTYLRAIAAHVDGAVRLAQGDATGAMRLLRGAWSAYREIEAPYEAARARELLGLACRAVGDAEAAEMELDAARAVYEELAAAPDIARLRRAPMPRPSGGPALSPRELEIVALVSRGLTNAEIAADLVISEKTVARHMSNIFTKLELGSRAALTAYAYEHGLTRRPA